MEDPRALPHDAQNLQLSDLMVAYPSVLSSNLQTLISAKKEFADVGATDSETVPNVPGVYMNHQKFILRYLRAYADLLLMHETGTGKTCSMAAYTEWAVEHIEDSNVNRIYFISSSALKDEFRRQLVYRCTAGKYITESVMKARASGNQDAEKSAITNAIKGKYSFYTYVTFAKHIMTNYPLSGDAAGDAIVTQRLAKDFANCIFLIDEAHELISGDFEGEAKKQVGSKSNLAVTKQQVYEQIYRVFHTAPNCRHVLATATPMINSVDELKPLMNLLLPLNMQFLPTMRLQDMTLQQLEPYFRGRVSYIRAMRNGLDPVNQRNPNFAQETGNNTALLAALPNLSNATYNTVMSDHQTAGYNKVKGSTNNMISDFSVQASNFVFPDGNAGGGKTQEEKLRARQARDRRKGIAPAAMVPVNIVPGKITMENEDEVEEDIEALELANMRARSDAQAFERYVTFNQNTNKFEPTAEFRPYLDDPASRRAMSCKFDTIVNKCAYEPGNAYVYCNKVYGSGVITMGLMFEALGFEQFNSKTSIFTTDASGNKVLRPEYVTPRARYALFTGLTTPPQKTAILEAMNCKENVNGAILKVFITTDVGRQGINVFNCLQGHIANPEWHESGIYQALSRIIRADSHSMLLELKRQEFIRMGLDPDTATIEVKIYRHCAFPNTARSYEDSIDMYYYTEAQRKDIPIHRVLRIMKQCAVDCQVHRGRNIRPTDIPGSPTCDYESCDYQCVDPVPVGEYDFTTYILLYADDQIAAVEEQLKAYFKENPLSTFSQISQDAGMDTTEYVTLAMALENLVNKKTILYDRYGMPCYLREDNGVFYTDRQYPTEDSGKVMESVYSESLITVNDRKFSEVLNILERPMQQVMTDNLERLNPDSQQFMDALSAMSLQNKTSLVENAIIAEASGRSTPMSQAIVRIYSNFIFEMPEPTAAIALANYEITRTGKRGKKRDLSKPPVAPSFKDDDPLVTGVFQGTLGPRVFVHVMELLDTPDVSYGNSARYKNSNVNLRLMKPGLDGSMVWTSPTYAAVNVYRAAIYNIRMNRNAHITGPFFATGRPYGIYVDNTFKIVGDESWYPNKQYIGRARRTGQNTESIQFPTLFTYLWQLKYYPPGWNVAPYNDTMINRIASRGIKSLNNPAEIVQQTGGDQARMAFYSAWMDYLEATYGSITQDRIAQLVREYMETNGLVIS